MNVVQLKREGAPSSASAKKEDAPDKSAAAGVKKDLRGMSFDAAEKQLTPEGGGAAVQKKEEAPAAMGAEAQQAQSSAKSESKTDAKGEAKGEGAKTESKDTKDAKSAVGAKKEQPEAKGSFGSVDPGNRIAALHPTFVDYVRRVIDIAHGKGLDIMIVQGMRTIAEQNDLYAQGRTKKGPVVTWVRGGSSYHNYGLAVDFAFHGKDPWSEKHDWKGLVASVREAGLISGASYGDRPHCNLDIPMRQLQGWYGKGGMRNVWDHVSEQVGGPRYPGAEAESKQAEPGGGEKKGEGSAPKKGDAGGAGGGYTVKQGDTLIEIAERLLGDGARWHEIADLNGIKDARDLAPGKVLKVPTGAAAAKKKDDGEERQGGEAHFRQRSHTVVRGETLTSIAQKFYGIASLWTEIAMANGIEDPTKVAVGQKLTIPAAGEKTKTAPPKKDIPMTHLVVSGDTLTGIAQQHYGDQARWREIASANHITDPKALRIGQKLTIPAR